MRSLLIVAVTQKQKTREIFKARALDSHLWRLLHYGIGASESHLWRLLRYGIGASESHLWRLLRYGAFLNNRSKLWDYFVSFVHRAR